MADTAIAHVVREVTVSAPIDTCFTTFVDGFPPRSLAAGSTA